MIRIDDFTKKYGENIIFDHANYTFPKQGLVCLLGVSGSGKSSLLNVLAGFDVNYSGSITVGGILLNTLQDDELCAYRRDHIGFVFQDYHLLKGYTVIENILLTSPLRTNDMSFELIRANEILKTVGLIDKKNQKIENLSGGQKQRVAIARALMGDATILLADEPTGALDRENSTAIMTLLKEIALHKLVVVITHDPKISAFADQVITITEGKIIGDSLNKEAIQDPLTIQKSSLKVPIWKRSFKNFKIHFKRYMAVSFAISIGIFCFLLSSSFKNVIQKSIDQFQQKNTAFNNGYIKIEKNNSDEVFQILNKDQRIENIYDQYKLENLTLKFESKTEIMLEKYPMAKANADMSYGIMPKRGANEIALSPSLAKKISKQINEMIGKKIILTWNNQQYQFTVSGIYNVGYDDFFISSDIEEQLYQGINDQVYSISYDVKRFENIIDVHKTLEEQGIKSENAHEEVAAFQTTFQSIERLFGVISLLIFGICLFISTILLIKLRNSRYREIGLLSALGFNRRTIKNMIVCENLLLSIFAIGLNAIWIGSGWIISTLFQLPFQISFFQIFCSILTTFLMIVGIGLVTSYQLFHIEPATALKK